MARKPPRTRFMTRCAREAGTLPSRFLTKPTVPPQRPGVSLKPTGPTCRSCLRRKKPFVSCGSCPRGLCIVGPEWRMKLPRSKATGRGDQKLRAPNFRAFALEKWGLNPSRRAASSQHRGTSGCHCPLPLSLGPRRGPRLPASPMLRMPDAHSHSPAVCFCLRITIASFFWCGTLRRLHQNSVAVCPAN